MMKKAQGLSVTTVVIAALAVLVLVVLAVVFMGRSTIFVRQVTGCEASGGVCKAECTTDELTNPINAEDKQLKCTNEELSCCVSKAIAPSLGISTGI